MMMMIGYFNTLSCPLKIIPFSIFLSIQNINGHIFNLSVLFLTKFNKNIFFNKERIL